MWLTLSQPSHGSPLAVILMTSPSSQIDTGWAFIPPRQKALVTGALTGGLFLITAAAVLFSYQVKPPPDYAKVIADGEKFTYASTPCILFNTLDREMIANRPEIGDPKKEIQLLPFANEQTMGDMRADKKWQRDKTCNAAIGYDQIVTVWMRLLGYRSRWDSEGVWRW